MAVKDLLLHQMDVMTAFLDSELDEEVFTEQPRCYDQSDSNIVVCHLDRALYGLKQSPRQFYSKNHQFFPQTLGMNRILCGLFHVHP